MLKDNQLQAVEMYVSGMPVTELSEQIGITRKTFYDWFKKDEFQKAIEEALELRVKEMKQQIRGRAKEYILILEDVAKKSKNDMARVTAVTKLLGIIGLDPGTKQEITVSHGKEDDSKNDLMDILQNKKAS
ncbi:terminase gpP N-terminus-related DNA-binding protein [Candidatus Contubernalis alkaliaceticus]|uniref:terminase gpP N-terminus-related DNA-binding protein n=1 Tax=Candidatus Contubernalis alkaliaceticus TaxID=338645 RepID=UPI001F4BEC0E|nr:helix-turn-helix domain-containing protein [Candidatus Contubernalis alkalaceticus]UNC92722.1 helix-turn-helix domain-containing protein [Candidatus Contubernalis alkalaceticus]